MKDDHQNQNIPTDPRRFYDSDRCEIFLGDTIRVVQHWMGTEQRGVFSGYKDCAKGRGFLIESLPNGLNDHP